MRDQPQAQQVAFEFGLGGILEGGAVVQDRQVVEPHRLAGPGHEAQRETRIERDLVDPIERRDLLRRQRPAHFLGRHFDVRTQVVDAEFAAVKAEDRNLLLGHRRLARRLLAEAVIVETLHQDRHRRGRARENLVVDRKRADVAADAARARGLQAQHRDDVAGVGVHVELGAVAVGALLRVLAADVDDVAEPVAHDALRHRRAEMRAEAEKDHAELVAGKALRRQPAQDHETAAAHDLGAPARDVGVDRAEIEVGARDRLGVAGLRLHRAQRALERVEVTRVEIDAKAFAVALGGAPQAGMIGGNRSRTRHCPRPAHDASRRSGARRVTAPPSPSMISVRPRSA